MVIFKPDGSRLLAIIDWELSTIGHPFSDLAYQCMQWRFPNYETMRGLASVDRKALGIPTEEEYVAKYCERMAIPGIPSWKYCLAFSFFRLAAIVQGVKKALTPTGAVGTKFSALPENVQKTILARAPQADISDISRHEDKGRVIYEVSFKDSDKYPSIRIADYGTLVQDLQK